jgi:hypothetical protein
MDAEAEIHASFQRLKDSEQEGKGEHGTQGSHGSN